MDLGRLIGAASLAVLLACGADKKVTQTEDPSSDEPEAGKPRDAGKDARVDGSKPGKTDAGVVVDDDDDDDTDDGAADPKLGNIEPINIDGCKGGALDDKTVAALSKGGDPAGVRMVYPYDGTVFPRGIEGPLLMWDGMDGWMVANVALKDGQAPTVTKKTIPKCT